MMRFGRTYNFGDVIIAEVQYVDTFEVKSRPAIVLFEEYGNIICVAVTSNPNIKGIKLTKKEGAIVDSVIKMNYIFTISENMVKKTLFRLIKEKREIIKDDLVGRLIV